MLALQTVGVKVVLDIETVPFSKKFENAKGNIERRRLAPRPTLACLYIIEARRYRFFLSPKFGGLISLLHEADEIVTFYGERFDFLVLERWCGLERSRSFKEKCIDLWAVNAQRPFLFLTKPKVRRANLDRLGKLNFGMPRKATGTTKEKCRAHVRLTYLLYRAFRNGTALHAVRPEKSLPTICPECGRPSELVPFHPDYTGMTEGQIFDYELGQQVGGWGFARCTNKRCGRMLTWGI